MNYNYDLNVNNIIEQIDIGFDDMVKMNTLNEKEILNNLKLRYE